MAAIFLGKLQLLYDEAFGRLKANTLDMTEWCQWCVVVLESLEPTMNEWMNGSDNKTIAHLVCTTLGGPECALKIARVAWLLASVCHKVWFHVSAPSPNSAEYQSVLFTVKLCSLRVADLAAAALTEHEPTLDMLERVRAAHMQCYHLFANVACFVHNEACSVLYTPSVSVLRLLFHGAGAMAPPPPPQKQPVEADVAKWCRANKVTLFNGWGNVGGSLIEFWKSLLQMREAWSRNLYEAEALAYLYYMEVQCAHFTCTERYERSDALFIHKAYNHPLFIERSPAREPGFEMVSCNANFVGETKAVFRALHLLVCQSTQLPWTFKYPKYRKNTTSSPELVQRQLECLDAFDRFLEKHLASYEQFIKDQFDAMICAFYELPGDPEMYARLHPNDDAFPEGRMSTLHPATYNSIRAAYIEPSLTTLWATLRRRCPKPGAMPPFADDGRADHAYSLIVMLVLNYYFEAHLQNSQFSIYVHSLTDLTEPFDVGMIHDDLSQFLCSVWTLKPTMPGATMKAAADDANFMRTSPVKGVDPSLLARPRDYRHPLILRTVGRQYVVWEPEHSRLFASKPYDSHMINLSGAFFHWLGAMCSDPVIDGTLASGSTLHELHRLFPEPRTEFLVIP